jgi:hypothetical protein
MMMSFVASPASRFRFAAAVDQSNFAISRRSVAPFPAAMFAPAEQAAENALQSLREAPTGEPGESGAP